MFEDDSPGVPVNWIIDTGCSNDIVSEKIAAGFKRIASGQIHKMKTANGVIATDSLATIPIPEFNQTANPRVYKNTPALLAIGDRCMNHNYGFHWEPGRNPYITLPDGKKVVLQVVSGVPVLASRGSAAISGEHDMAAAVKSMNISSVALQCTDEVVDDDSFRSDDDFLSCHSSEFDSTDCPDTASSAPSVYSDAE